ncbi:MAG: hypothetical protein JWP07_1806 [Pseudonocardiales bacterium]|nr:hypothetical protein [Pseudonocardiales bacterium]
MATMRLPRASVAGREAAVYALLVWRLAFAPGLISIDSKASRSLAAAAVSRLGDNSSAHAGEAARVRNEEGADSFISLGFREAGVGPAV